MRGRLWVVALAGLVAACASRPLAPRSRRAWGVALASAQGYAAENQFAQADSVLQAYVVVHPESPDTLEALFWRALYGVDPANNADSAVAGAVGLLDRYLASTDPQARRYEAQALRRFAELRLQPPVVVVDTVRAVDTAAVRIAVARAVAERDRVRDEEALKLRDSLTRVTAELERIRRRLARPRP